MAFEAHLPEAPAEDAVARFGSAVDKLAERNPSFLPDEESKRQAAEFLAWMVTPPSNP